MSSGMLPVFFCDFHLLNLGVRLLPRLAQPLVLGTSAGQRHVFYQADLPCHGVQPARHRVVDTGGYINHFYTFVDQDYNLGLRKYAALAGYSIVFPQRAMKRSLTSGFTKPLGHWPLKTRATSSMGRRINSDIEVLDIAPV